MFSQLIVLSTLALGALALPQPPSEIPGLGGKQCLTQKDATQVAGLWQELIGNYSKATAEAALTLNYSDYSASALSLNGVCLQAPGPKQALTDPLFTNRTIFELAQGSQPPIPSKNLKVSYGCDSVTMRIEYCIAGNCTLPVVGVILIETVKAPKDNKYPFQIATTYSEFDSEAWIQNLKNANNCVDPATAPKPPSKRNVFDLRG